MVRKKQIEQRVIPNFKKRERLTKSNKKWLQFNCVPAIIIRSRYQAITISNRSGKAFRKKCFSRAFNPMMISFLRKRQLKESLL